MSDRSPEQSKQLIKPEHSHSNFLDKIAKKVLAANVSKDVLEASDSNKSDLGSAYEKLSSGEDISEDKIKLITEDINKRFLQPRKENFGEYSKPIKEIVDKLREYLCDFSQWNTLKDEKREKLMEAIKNDGSKSQERQGEKLEPQLLENLSLDASKELFKEYLVQKIEFLETYKTPWQRIADAYNSANKEIQQKIADALPLSVKPIQKIPYLQRIFKESIDALPTVLSLQEARDFLAKDNNSVQRAIKKGISQVEGTPPDIGTKRTFPESIRDYCLLSVFRSSDRGHLRQLNEYLKSDKYIPSNKDIGSVIIKICDRFKEVKNFGNFGREADNLDSYVQDMKSKSDSVGNVQSFSDYVKEVVSDNTLFQKFYKQCSQKKEISDSDKKNLVYVLGKNSYLENSNFRESSLKNHYSYMLDRLESQKEELHQLARLYELTDDEGRAEILENLPGNNSEENLKADLENVQCILQKSLDDLTTLFFHHDR